MNPACASMPDEFHHADTIRRVHTVTDRFSMNNTYLLNEEKLVVVDPCSILNVQLLESYLQRVLHRTISEVDLIVLTHLHPDHTAGVEALRRLCRAPVAASAVAHPFASSQIEEWRAWTSIPHFTRPTLSNTFAPYHYVTPSYAQQSKMVNIWLEDSTELPAHQDWRVITSPGHSPESLCLYNAFTQELLCGDTVVTASGRTPLIRSGVDRRRLEETLRVLHSLNVHYLYPGHGRAVLGEDPLQQAEVAW